MTATLVKLAVTVAAASSAVAILTPAQFQAQAVSWIGALVAVLLMALAGYTQVVQKLHDAQALAVKTKADATVSLAETQATTAANTAHLNDGIDARFAAISAANTADLAALETRLTQAILEHERLMADNVSTVNRAAAATGAAVAGGVAATLGSPVARGGGGLIARPGWEEVR